MSSTIKTPSLDEALKLQDLTLEPGETAVRYRDLTAQLNALKLLGNRYIKQTEGRIHVARCFRILKGYLDEYSDERRKLEASKPAENIDDTSVSATIVELNRKIAALSAMYVGVKYPSKIKPSFLPVNEKSHPNNEDGLAMILADLGEQLYPIDLDEEDDEPEPTE